MKERFIWRFPPKKTSEPVTYRLIKDYDLMINILKGEISAGKVGKLLVEVEADEANLKRGLEYLEKNGVEILSVKNTIKLDKDKCIHCGACTSVCFSGALDMDRKTWELKFAPENCIACGQCARACPLRLFTLGFGEL